MDLDALESIWKDSPNCNAPVVLSLIDSIRWMEKVQAALQESVENWDKSSAYWRSRFDEVIIENEELKKQGKS